MELKDKIMSDIGFLDILIKNSEWLLDEGHYLRLKILREHLIEAHKKLKSKQ
ncbi:hypothetical protein LCGC14_1474750 [marine sediment metagenome]|uniref:Uncharacterized protein n=1 Tax=marine sediment metagenome TaxID=412755 RepID=A0A0F9JBA6_9ZZZZ